MFRYRAVIAFVMLLVISCNSDYTLRRRGYFKIDFPPHTYQTFNEASFPFTFEYPTYSTIVKDTNFLDDQADNPWSINVDIPRFNGKIYMSYKQIRDNNFDKLVTDAFTMTYKHTTKATEIRDSLMKTESGLTGVFFYVGGNAATANQFFITDSVKHFLRGALYFDATPNEDSLKVVNEFLKQDMRHLINTLKWTR